MPTDYPYKYKFKKGDPRFIKELANTLYYKKERETFTLADIYDMSSFLKKDYDIDDFEEFIDYALVCLVSRRILKKEKNGLYYTFIEPDSKKKKRI